MPQQPRGLQHREPQTLAEIQPSHVGGGQVPAPSRARHPCTPRSWGCSAGTRGAQSTATHSCLAPGQALQGTGIWLQPCPFQPGRAAGKGPALRCCRGASPPAQPSPAQARREVQELCWCPTLHPPAPCEWGGRCSAPRGQGSAGPEQQAWSCCRAVPTELSYVTQPAGQLAL